MSGEYTFPRDKNGIAIWPEIAYLDKHNDVAIRRFSPTRKYTVSLSMIHSYYSWQAIEITNSIQSIVFGRDPEKHKEAALLCRKASIALGEAAKVGQELKREMMNIANKRKKD